MLRVALADDAVLLREGLIVVLARFGHEVVAAVGDAVALAVRVKIFEAGCSGIH